MKTYLLVPGLIGLLAITLPAFCCDDNDGPILDPQRAEISDVPWTPQWRVDREKAIYGDDDRLDVYQETDPTRRAWAASTCAIIRSSRLIRNSDGSYDLDAAAWMMQGFPPCEDEPFANQPVAAFCSAFMVDHDIIATAGHCLEEQDLPGIRFVFGFEMLDAETPVLTFSEEQIYTGVELVAHDFFIGLEDYALVRVERTITVADPLPLRRDGEIAVGEQVGVIGHPSGLPKKIAFGAATRVLANQEGAPSFRANLDSFPGNSGSPVFNVRTGLVEGILVMGAGPSFVVEEDCFRVNMLPDDNNQHGAEVNKSTLFADILYDDRCCRGCRCRGRLKDDFWHFLGDYLLIGLSVAVLLLLTAANTKRA